MSIAEKLTQIAENQQRVYDAGFIAGQAQGGSGDNGSYEEGYEQGKQAEYDRFWDVYQDNGNRNNYASAFGGTGWSEETFNPKYDIITTSTYMMFRGIAIKDLGKAISGSGVKVSINTPYLQYTFQISNIEIIEGLEFLQQLELIETAFQCPKLRKIQTLPISENATQLVFTNIPLLEEVTFSGVIPVNISFAQSSKLSMGSVQSIIDHLKDLTGATAQKVSFHTTVLAKLTDVQVAAILAKNWTM